MHTSQATVHQHTGHTAQTRRLRMSINWRNFIQCCQPLWARSFTHHKEQQDEGFSEPTSKHRAQSSHALVNWQFHLFWMQLAELFLFHYTPLTWLRSRNKQIPLHTQQLTDIQMVNVLHIKARLECHLKLVECQAGLPYCLHYHPPATRPAVIFTQRALLKDGTAGQLHRTSLWQQSLFHNWSSSSLSISHTHTFRQLCFQRNATQAFICSWVAPEKGSKTTQQNKTTERNKHTMQSAVQVQHKHAKAHSSSKLSREATSITIFDLLHWTKTISRQS